MKTVIIVVSFLVSVFIFLLISIIKSSDLQVVLKRIKGNSKSLFKRRVKFGFIDDLKFLIDEEGSVKVLGFKFNSLESLFLIRVTAVFSFFITFVLVGFLLGKNFVFYAIAASVIFYFLPVEILKGKMKDRSKKVLDELPDVVDIFSSLIKAGLSLDEAIKYVSSNYEGEISKLFKLAQTKIFGGYGKKEAYYNIARLSFCNDFKTVIKILIQSDIVGNPIKDILRDLSKVIRNNQRDLLKMKAERLENNLVIVIFIFIFIPMLLLFLLPVFPQLKILF